VWAGCGQRAVYTMPKHGGLADRAITELWPCLTLSLFLFSAAESQFLRNVFLSHWTTHLAHCTAVPYSPRTCSGLSMGVIITRLLPDSTRYYIIRCN